MTYRIEPFRAEHFYELMPQARQQTDLANMAGRDDWSPESLIGQEFATSAFCDDRLLGFAIVTPLWVGRACVSVFFSVEMNRYSLLWAYRTIVAKLDELQVQPRFRRIEASVLESFPQAHRMICGMGFVSEGLMRRYDPAGRDHRLYARVR